MTMQANLAPSANKTQVTFNAAAFTAPVGATSNSIYNAAGAANFYRDNEVRGCIEKLMNYAKANAKIIHDQLALGAVPLYAVVGIGNGYGAISLTSLLADITANKVAIGFAVANPVLSSEQVWANLVHIRDAMWEQERIYA